MTASRLTRNRMPTISTAVASRLHLHPVSASQAPGDCDPIVGMESLSLWLMPVRDAFFLSWYLFILSLDFCFSCSYLTGSARKRRHLSCRRCLARNTPETKQKPSQCCPVLLVNSLTLFQVISPSVHVTKTLWSSGLCLRHHDTQVISA